VSVELAIFANKEEIEVSSIDIETGRVDRFGEGKYVSPPTASRSNIRHNLHSHLRTNA